MKRLILLLSLFSATIALGVDTKPIGNPVSGGATSFFSNIGGTVTTVGGISNPGAWTVGRAFPGANYNGPANFINGHLWAGGLTSADESGLLTIGVNTYAGTQSGLAQRTQTTLGGFAFQMDPRTSGNSFISVLANKDGDGLTATPKEILRSSEAGAWTFGPASTGTLLHQFNGGRLTIAMPDTSIGMIQVKQPSTTLQIGVEASTPGWGISGLGAQEAIIATNGRAINFATGSSVKGRLDTSGVWTLPVARSGTLTGSVTGSSYVDFAGLLSNGAQFSMFCTATTSGSTPGGALAYFWSTPGDGYTNVQALFGVNGFTLGLNSYSVRLSNSGATKDYVCNYTYTHKP